jgi:hypothetical protein
MSEKFALSFQYFRKMSALKKVLIVFTALLIFIIVVEQPGSDASKKRKNEKFFIPKMAVEQIGKIDIKRANVENPVMLEKKDDQWKVANGHSLPADQGKVGDFLQALLNLKQGALVSKNKDRISIFSVDEAKGIRVRIWDDKNRSVADFYAGETIPDGQYLRRADSNDVYQTMPSLNAFLQENSDGWKDKTLLSVKEEDVRRLALNSPSGETVLEKGQASAWRVTQPEDYEADSLSIRTLFDQLKQVKADAFVDSVEGSQINFEKPDYKISIRKSDDSLILVLFAGPTKDGKYYAKNPDSNFIYSVSKSLIDNIFGLKFKPAATTPAAMTPASKNK